MMTETEREELTKKAYLEVLDIVRQEISDLKKILDEKYVHADSCMIRAREEDAKFANYDKAFLGFTFLLVVLVGEKIMQFGGWLLKVL